MTRRGFRVRSLDQRLEAVVHERRRSQVLEAPLVALRQGVMLHYDDSSRDEWALEWFNDPRCKNGYTWVVLDDGRVVQLADHTKRTPHAGSCRTANANSAFYGIAATTNGVVPATPAQVEAIVGLCAAIGLPRIVGHDEEAIWAPVDTRRAGMADDRGRLLWGKGGRKVDPTGLRKDGVPIIDAAQVRRRVAAALAARVAA